MKATKNNVPKAKAQPLFKYKNAKGNIGEWYAKTDVTITKPTPKEKAVKVTQQGFTSEQLTKIQALIVSGVL